MYIIWYIVPNWVHHIILYDTSNQNEPERTEMSLPPFVPDFRNLANRVPISRFRTGAFRVPCDYGFNND
jgi:hypothetical protein